MARLRTLEKQSNIRYLGCLKAPLSCPKHCRYDADESNIEMLCIFENDGQAVFETSLPEVDGL